MIHRFKREDNPCFVLLKQCVQNNKLSLKAKGLHCYLMSLGDNDVLSLSGIIEASSDGRSSVLGALEELKIHGYINTITDDKNATYEAFETPKEGSYVAKPDINNDGDANENQTKTGVKGLISELGENQNQTKKGVYHAVLGDQPVLLKNAMKLLKNHYETTMSCNVTLDTNESSASKDANDSNDYSKALSRDVTKSNIPSDVGNQIGLDSNWSKMIMKEWHNVFKSYPVVWELKLIKPLCKEHGVDKVIKALIFYLNNEDKKYISLKAFSSKFGYWLSKAGISLKSQSDIQNEETLRYQKPSRQ
jgi:hypothetical protein